MNNTIKKAKDNKKRQIKSHKEKNKEVKVKKNSLTNINPREKKPKKYKKINHKDH